MDLVRTLSKLKMSSEIILVSMDVISLYPSIPQSECLEIIHQEMVTHADLLICDPNPVIQLLHVNINHKYFDFNGFILQQIHGSHGRSHLLPNIFMSVLFRKCLHSQQTQEVPCYNAIPLCNRYDNVEILYMFNWQSRIFPVAQSSWSVMVRKIDVTLTISYRLPLSNCVLTLYQL